LRQRRSRRQPVFGQIKPFEDAWRAVDGDRSGKILVATGNFTKYAYLGVRHNAQHGAKERSGAEG
jgi:hypothetical protein